MLHRIGVVGAYLMAGVCLLILVVVVWAKLTWTPEQWAQYPPGDLDRGPFPVERTR